MISQSWVNFFRQILLAMIFTFIIQYLIPKYFFSPNEQLSSKQAVSGQSFMAAQVGKTEKPLLLDIDFNTTEAKEVQLHAVKTPLATYEFSSKGAVLSSLNFEWQDNKKTVPMFAQNSECFLLGLDGKTPLYYNFVKEEVLKDDAITSVEYKTSFDQGTITKIFLIHHDTYQVDVKVGIDYKSSEKNNTEQVRLFFPMPTLSSDYGAEESKAFVNKTLSSSDINLEAIALNKDSLKRFWFEPKVFGLSNKFMAQAFVGSDKQGPARAYLKKDSNEKYKAILESNDFTQDTMFIWSFYCGPKTESAMTVVSPFLVQTLDYGWMTFLAKPMLALLNRIQEYTGSYGIAIILLILLLKLILLPFTMRGERSMKQGAELQKKLNYLKQKYKHDKEALDRASAELIQKHGIPGFAGCLPMFLNIPFFFALNRVLSNSIDLYGSSFLWLPDLSAKDPYYILSILIIVSMLFMPGGNDPKQAMSKYVVAIMIGTFSVYLSSGLSLFILTSTVLGIVQTFITKKFTAHRA